MAKDFINRYVWIVDTLRRYGKLTREQLDNLWVRSQIGDGQPIPRRTFFYYRRAIEENFNITIACDSAGRYYIDHDDSARQKAYTNWILDSFAINNALKGTTDTHDRVEVEDVPSAREFLPAALDAIRRKHKINFSYAGFNRSRTERNIMFRPYFLKRYKQRWYMVGLRERSQDIRTYALDRVRDMQLINSTFSLPEDISMSDIFGNIIGITSSKGEVKKVVLKATSTQAKYLRALPLHTSQHEEIHDQYSIFTYKLKLNWELVHELLGMGSQVKVLNPPELKAMVLTELRQTIQLYQPEQPTE